jgi:hypothetical protein
MLQDLDCIHKPLPRRRGVSHDAGKVVYTARVMPVSSMVGSLAGRVAGLLLTIAALYIELPLRGGSELGRSPNRRQEAFALLPH